MNNKIIYGTDEMIFFILHYHDDVHVSNYFYFFIEGGEGEWKEKEKRSEVSGSQ